MNKIFHDLCSHFMSAKHVHNIFTCVVCQSDKVNHKTSTLKWPKYFNKLNLYSYTCIEHPIRFIWYSNVSVALHLMKCIWNILQFILYNEKRNYNFCVKINSLLLFLDMHTQIKHHCNNNLWSKKKEFSGSKKWTIKHCEITLYHSRQNIFVIQWS